RATEDGQLIDAVNGVEARVEAIAPVRPDVAHVWDLAEDAARGERVRLDVLVLEIDAYAILVRKVDQVTEPFVAAKRALRRVPPRPAAAVAIVVPPNQVDVEVLEALVQE